MKVEVEPATPEQLRLLIDDVAAFERHCRLQVVPGYVEFEDALPHALAALEGGMPARWWTHLFVHSSERALIGLGGYTGPPQQGSVEIGYGIAPAYRGRGLAAAAAARLIDRASVPDVHTVQAHTLAQPNASTHVLESLGFTRTAEINDPDDEPIWRWQLPLRDTPAPCSADRVLDPER